MGLDMYLEGTISHYPAAENDEGNLTKEVYELGYWRKHPDLHGFIVNEFNGGKDECDDIELGADELQIILTAVKENNLPKTTGFFFGESVSADEQDTTEKLLKAMLWLNKPTKNRDWRFVIYNASW